MARKISLGLDHISLMLSNLEEGIRFFHKMLGLPVMTEVRDDEKEVVVVRAGRVYLELWQRDRCSPDNMKSVDKKPVYLNHIAFEVKNIEEVIEVVSEAGYEILSPINVPTDGVREAMVQGPDGLQVQFIEQNISKLVWRTVSGALGRDKGPEDDQEEDAESEAR